MPTIKFRTNWEDKFMNRGVGSGLEDKSENYFIMNYVLTAINGQTKLEIIQEDNRPNAVQEESQGEENPILKSLKDMVETE